jgi:hypothetical protein
MDYKTSLYIAYGTKATNANGYALATITVTQLEEYDAPQAGVYVMGMVYELGPRGASFDPPITLTIKYDEAGLSPGMPESSLGLAIWDEESGTYKTIPCQVDMEANQITASISHFSRYAVISEPRPAAFTLSGLTISPESVNPGGTINIGLTVANTGDFSGNYTLRLRIDSETIEERTIPVAGGGSEKVSFTEAMDTPGEHTVSVGGMSGVFEVKSSEVQTTPAPEPVVPPPPEVTTTPVPEPATTPAPSTGPVVLTPTSTPQPQVTISPIGGLPDEGSSVPWRLIGIFLGFALVVGILVFAFLKVKKNE